MCFAFANRVKLAGDVGDLLQEELVDLQPVGGIRMREQMMDHVIHAEIREP